MDPLSLNELKSLEPGTTVWVKPLKEGFLNYLVPPNIYKYKMRLVSLCNVDNSDEYIDFFTDMEYYGIYFICFKNKEDALNYESNV